MGWRIWGVRRDGGDGVVNLGSTASENDWRKGGGVQNWG